MQPDPSKASKPATSVNNTCNPPSTTQHGQQNNDLSASGASPQDGLAKKASKSSLNEDDVSALSSTAHRGRTNNSRRLSSRHGSSQGSSPGSRVDEYEKSHTSVRKHSAGMIFQVIPSNGKKDGLSVQNFPNEVLTHIMSHLPPETLSSMSLVSRQFHRLVTTPTPWRIAFSYFFQGQESLLGKEADSSEQSQGIGRTQRRSFTRLSALASWRSEYILRTRLLHSLSRGRPALQGQITSGTSKRSVGNAVVTYRSGLTYPVSHIHALFGTGLNKKQPLLVHGAVEQGAVSVSDPLAAVSGSWGVGDFEEFRHFADAFLGEVEYGLGPGDIVGMSNVMDISQPYGKIYGEACPRGRLYYTSAAEQRGRFLPINSTADYEAGIPHVDMTSCAVCSVWIAKSDAALKATNGLLGCLAGFSNGVLASYALGVNPVQDRRLEKGEPTARWVLSPGVPIIGICIDDRVSNRRLRSSRVWAVVLNALGEIFYLTETFTRPDFKGKASASDLDRLSWQTGRTVEWKLIESTKRIAKPDPFGTAAVDGSYSPRTSSDVHGLDTEQIVAETKEVESFLLRKPKWFRQSCEGWDMRRKLVVDFAGDDSHGTGEAIFVFSCGLDDATSSSILRLTRRKIEDLDNPGFPLKLINDSPGKSSTFSPQSSVTDGPTVLKSLHSPFRSRTSSQDEITKSKSRSVWWISNFSFAEYRNLQISALATDDSDFAQLLQNEDPLLSMSGGSNTSSPVASPVENMSSPLSSAEIPGQRARFCAAGTTSGIVILWDMRAGLSRAPDVINSVQPVRIIHTKSPQISSLALTALYLVHGGNDGLVQAWDPLASTTEPVRTLNSRFSDRARRRIAQAEASVHGVGNNYYAAGAIALDPDPTMLRGVVSLGTFLRYWSYSSTAADAYKSKKRGRHGRRSERGSNSASAEQKVSATARGALRDYITSERLALERDEAARHKEDDRIVGRFGTDLLGAGASDEEVLAYATMLSEEAWMSDEMKRKISEENSVLTSPAFKDFTGAGFSGAEDLDANMEEAIRLSLLENEQHTPSPINSDFDLPIRYTTGSKRNASGRKTKIGKANQPESSTEDDDLQYALQMSIAEQQSKSSGAEDFPALAGPSKSEIFRNVKGQGEGKGKGKSGRE